MFVVFSCVLCWLVFVFVWVWLVNCLVGWLGWIFVVVLVVFGVLGIGCVWILLGCWWYGFCCVEWWLYVGLVGLVGGGIGLLL